MDILEALVLALSSEMTMVFVITILAVISPGPDFAVTTRNTLKYGREAGLATALGIATGISVHVTYTVLGFGLLISQSVWLLEVMRYAGAVYLIYLGVSSFLTKKPNNPKKPLQEVSNKSNRQAFVNGFLSNALNPKTTLFFIALFTQVVSAESSFFGLISLGAMIAIVHYVWFAMIAVVLSGRQTSAFFQVFNSWIERFLGLCLVGLGAQLALSK